MDLETIASEIVDAAVKLHIRLGPGLLESAYEVLLAAQLQRRGLQVERQKPIGLEYDGILVEEAYRADLLVEGVVLLELKSVERVAPIHKKQLKTYMRLRGIQLGFLINFGALRLVDGLHRLVNGYDGFVSSPLRGKKKFVSLADRPGASARGDSAGKEISPI